MVQQLAIVIRRSDKKAKAEEFKRVWMSGETWSIQVFCFSMRTEI